MARNCDDEKWVHSISNMKHEVEDEDEEDQEEALSLCDLPTSDQDNSRKELAAQLATKPQDHQDFDFGSWAAAEMCAADDVFFKGRILPLRHSISSESGLTKLQADNAGNISQWPGIARCASMDHCTSSGFTTNIATGSSRSSSVRSHNSASSGSTSTTTTLPPKGYNPKIRNQFHSHPSPSPQLRIPRGNHAAGHPNRKSSTMWRFFQVGLLRTPEIELIDLKIRSKNNTVHPFGSRNSSTSTSTSTSSVSNVENKKGTNISVTNGKKIETFYKMESLKKNKGRSGLFGSGNCKCSVETVPLNNYVTVKNGSKGGDQIKEGLLRKKKKKKKSNDQNQEGKQAMSRHRTFEWLKQLSLQEV